MNYSRFYNQEHSIELLFPETWERIDGFADSLVGFLSPHENEEDNFRDFLNVLIVEFFHPALDILDEFSKRSLVNLENDAQDFEIVNPLSDAELSELPAKHVYYNEKQGTFELKTHCIWTIYEYRAYILCATAKRNDFPKYEPIFDKIFESFQIFEAKNPPTDYSKMNR